MEEATRWGKDSVIIRHRLEKLPPNPEIDSPGRERASVRNPLSPFFVSRTYQFFFFFLSPIPQRRMGRESGGLAFFSPLGHRPHDAFVL